LKTLDDLINWFGNKKSVIVALSGGVDSGLVAYAAFQKLRGSAIAVTADYKTLSKEELENSKKICSEIGIKQIIIQYSELDNEDFVKNDNSRCFHCRTELAQHLTDLSIEQNISHIVDGTNLDDMGEYRPGITALKEAKIQSPLLELEFTKKMIRNEAKKIGLSFYDRPSNSCLASRIPWGQRVTAERLARIEMSEIIVKQMSPAKQVRVRDLNGIAKIEVNQDSLDFFHHDDVVNLLTSKLKMLGFSSVVIDPEGYRPGKLNVH
jgi:pyridinium-3,5-biscarboxylic acid mononucleotide sulfurtransferase